MKDKKLQIFVSSTYTDLKEERQAAVEAILSSGHIPAGMELFSAGDESQLTVIERWIDESDVYLLILGGRYGSIDKKTGKSYTQLEYEYAYRNKKPLFAVVINQGALEEKIKTIGSAVFEQENPKELKEFRSLVLNNLVKFWDDKKDIKIAIHETLSEIVYRKDLQGWIRGNNSVNTGFLAEEIARLTKENSDLRDQVKSYQTSNSSLYANLTYDQLVELLKREEVKFANIIQNLFEFFTLMGPKLAIGVSMDSDGEDNRNLLDKLLLYKLVRINGGTKSYTRIVLTEEGHNFYLRTLLNTSEMIIT